MGGIRKDKMKVQKNNWGMKVVLALLATVTMGGAMTLKNEVLATGENWGPKERKTFVWDKPADYPVFNSMTNNPKIGDERNFVRVKEFGTQDNYGDEVEVRPGKLYEVYVYYHNNAADNFNTGSGKGIANNVRLKTGLPTKLEAGQRGEIKGTIMATNTNPKEVFDTAFLKAKELVYMRYVPLSAKIHNSGSANGKNLDDKVMFGAEGVKLAYYQGQWGIIPGCNQYAGYVTFLLKADQPKFEVNKQVSRVGEAKWQEEISAKPGEILDFKIEYHNQGTVIQKAVQVKDELGEGMELMPGEILVKSSGGGSGNVGPDGSPVIDAVGPKEYKVAGDKFKDGLVLGDVLVGEKLEVFYKVKIKEKVPEFSCGKRKDIYNKVVALTANGNKEDKVKVDLGCNDPAPKEIPKTGPAEMALAVVIISGIGLGGGYLIWSKRKLKKMMEVAVRNEQSVEVLEEKREDL